MSGTSQQNDEQKTSISSASLIQNGETSHKKIKVFLSLKKEVGNKGQLKMKNQTWFKKGLTNFSILRLFGRISRENLLYF